MNKIKKFFEESVVNATTGWIIISCGIILIIVTLCISISIECAH